LGTPDDRTPETFWGACHDLFSRLIVKYPTCPIVVITPLHRWYEYVPQTRTSRDGTVTQTTILRDYVEIIRQAAEYYSLPVCDLYAAGSICPELEAHRTALCPDGLHPNDAGHEIIASRLASVLLSL
jgi:lysophospholipase L1-like esterase